jgi:hypothetical protein
MMGTKPNITTSYSGVPTTEDTRYRPGARMKGRYTEILFSFLVITVPMIVFSGLLLGLIFYYRVVPNESPSVNLTLRTPQYDDYFLVKLSSTTLITVASWSSTVAPILVGFSLTLVSYPVAKGMVNAVTNNNPDALPTPYQLGLMLRMVATSGPGTLASWLWYSIGWKVGVNRQRQPKPMKLMTSILSLGLILRYNIASHSLLVISFPIGFID